MVLCISAIAYKGDGKVLHQQPQQDQAQHAEQQQAVKGAGNQAQVQLTDGWYGAKAVLDQPLTKLLQTGKLKLGMCSDAESPAALCCRMSRVIVLVCAVGYQRL